MSFSSFKGQKRDLLQALYPKCTKFRRYEKGRWKGHEQKVSSVWKGHEQRVSSVSEFSHTSLEKVLKVSNKNIRD